MMELNGLENPVLIMSVDHVGPQRILCVPTWAGLITESCESSDV